MMPPPAGRSTFLLMRDLMFEALCVNNGRLNTLAFELFVRTGEQAVCRLVLATCDRKNPAGFRLRALEAIARIGPATDPANVADLGVIAARDRAPKVREAAAGSRRSTAKDG
jgi:hypothetical protein